MNFKILNQNAICVVTFNGDMLKADREVLSECSQNLKAIDCNAVILYFKNVSAIDPAVYRSLILVQFELRQRQLKLRATGLGLQLKTQLIEKGVMRSNELYPTLNDVITDLNR